MQSTHIFQPRPEFFNRSIIPHYDPININLPSSGNKVFEMTGVSNSLASAGMTIGSVSAAKLPTKRINKTERKAAYIVEGAARGLTNQSMSEPQSMRKTDIKDQR